MDSMTEEEKNLVWASVNGLVATVAQEDKKLGIVMGRFMDSVKESWEENTQLKRENAKYKLEAERLYKMQAIPITSPKLLDEEA